MDHATEKDLFLQALEIRTPEDRSRFLDKECGQDNILRESVEALLASDCPDDFLLQPAVPNLTESARSTATQTLQQGAIQIGEIVDERYELLEVLGQGGCGTVFLAQQRAPVRRKVALKVIRIGMDTDTVISRFETERQALAMMNHPNIANVLDGGCTETGRPYFVMELVQGIRITEYVREHCLSIEARLDLFVEICHAIEHAHQKGIIHRDIKPSNVLVCDLEDRPCPKVIDFGISKAVNQPAQERVQLTGIHLFLGTPAYTSPEQAAMSKSDVDTRSDVYSLGVLLYELLVGVPPFDPERLSESTLDGMRQIIREEDPLRPSHRLRQLDEARSDKLASREIREDLDWITVKCLEKDRNRRYQTVNELVKDITRFLSDEPILAHPPSSIYRFKRFCYRNQVAVSAAAIILLTLLISTGLSTWLAIRATRAEQEQSRLLGLAQQAQKEEEAAREGAERRRIEALQHSYNSDMNLVQMAIAANNWGRATDLLDRHLPNGRPSEGFQDPDLRNWEWHYFSQFTQSAASFSLPNQSSRIQTLAFGSENTIGTLDSQNHLAVWNLAANPQSPPTRSIDQVRHFALSSDGQFIAFSVGDRDQKPFIHIELISDPEQSWTKSFERNPSSFQFSPSGDALILLDHESQIERWHFASGRSTLTQLEASDSVGRRRGFQQKSFSPDATRLAIAQSGTVRIFDTRSGRMLTQVSPIDGTIASLAFSANGEEFAIGPSFTESDTRVHLFTTEAGESLGHLEGHTSWISGISYSPHGDRIFTSGADQTVRVWDAKNRTLLKTLRGHQTEVNCLALSPSAGVLVTGGKDGSLLGWNTDEAHNPAPYDTLSLPIRKIVFVPNSRHFLSLDRRGGIALWNQDNLQRIDTLSPELYEDLLVSSAGDRLYAYGRDGQLTSMDLSTREILYRKQINLEGERAPRLLAIDSTSQGLLTLNSNGNLRSWDPGSFSQQNLAQIPGRSRLAVSPMGPSVAFIGDNGQLSLLNWESQQLSSLPNRYDRPIGRVSFSSQGKLLAAASVDGTIQLWDTETQLPLPTLSGHLLGVHAVAFSPDGKRLASSSSAQEAVKLWDLDTYREIATLAGEGTLFNHISFSPDSTVLVGINFEGIAHFWRAPGNKQAQ